MFTSNQQMSSDFYSVLLLHAVVILNNLFSLLQQSGKLVFGWIRFGYGYKISYLENKKAVLSQRWPRNAPYTWVP